MKPRALLAIIFLAVLIAIPTMASAAWVHYFDCDQCHREGADWLVVGPEGVCITCHDGSGDAFSFPRTRPDSAKDFPSVPGGFVPDDASNAFGNSAGATSQSSHNWGAKDRNPAAGATAASSAMYSARASAGYVTCTKCHDPHAAYDAGIIGTNKMLRTKTIGDGTPTNSEVNVEAMCIECHVDWTPDFYGNVSNQGDRTHPLFAGDYNTVYGGGADPRFKTFDPTGTTMALLAGDAIGCSTCHGLHDTDSGGANDGKLLKADGPSIDDTTVCTTCHVYQSHPSSTGLATEFGCMVCHSGHSYNDGTPNYFVLRSEVDVPGTVSIQTAGTTVTGLVYDNPADPDAMWASYCTGCHGALSDSGPNDISATEDHSSGHEQCSLCHTHNDPGKSFAVSGGGCTSCHGTPPRVNTEGGPDGYAAGYAKYNEANTPHATHALAGSNPVMGTIACITCHTSYSGTHNNGTFQSVFDGADPALLTTGGLSPAYNPAADGTCSTVYCHSNGAATPTATSEDWNNGSTTGAITGCAACHDDKASGIGGVGPKGNTSAHDAHMTRYDCNVCHSQTTTDGSSVEIASGTHINGSVQLLVDETADLGGGNSTTIGSGSSVSAASCAVYCHSDGNGVTSDPAWSGSANCGSCHAITGAGIDALAGDGVHALHLSDPNGPGSIIAGDCSVCHTHNGSLAAGNGHIDKTTSVKPTACDSCHGKPGGGWTAVGTVDESPTWTDATTVRCDTCHSGTVANVGGAAPYVDEAAYSNGHGKTGVAQACTDCHEADTVADHLGGATIDRLDAVIQVSANAYAAGDDRLFCNVCHTTVGSVNNHSTADGTVCKTCHTQHGEDNGFDAMIMSTVAGNAVTGFTAQGTRASYVNDANTGICQTCHTAIAAPSVAFFTKTSDFTTDDAAHNAGDACSDCHTHDSTPKAFAGIGNACDACHGFPPANAAHDLHAPDSALLAGPVLIGIDRSACAFCHTGADLYTYSPSADQGSATPDRINHNVGVDNTARVAVLLASVGYDGTDCASACHDTATGQTAAWTGGSISCDACHYQAADPNQTDNTSSAASVSTGHDAHFAGGGAVVCTDCHAAVSDAGHITDRSGATEALKIQGMAEALQDEGDVLVGATFDDGANTCATASCHNDARPGTDVPTSPWGTDDTNCTQCHEASPTTGSHENHLLDDATCANCHTSAVEDTSYASANHLDDDIDVAAGGYPNNRTLNSSFTTCSTASCHDDGRAPNTTAIWGTGVGSCAECHAMIPATGSHASHVTNASIGCDTCHTGAAVGTTAPTSNHRNAKIDVNNGSYPTNRNLTSAFTTCTTASCHNDGQGTANGTTAATQLDSPEWGVNGATCGQCHDAVPSSAKHDEHLGAYGATCGDCHAGVTDGSTLPTANHINGTIDVITDMGGNTGFDYSLGSVGMTPGDAWGTCADPTNGCHGTPEARPWDNSASSCTSCHGASSTTGEPLVAGDMISTNSLGQHDTHVNANSYGCNTCHNGHGMPTIDDKVTIAFTGLAAGGGYNPPVLWTNTPDKWLYNQTSTTGTQDCSNLYCHSSGQADGGVAAATYATPDWGSAVTGACGTCHATSPATGAHAKHLAADSVPGTPIACNDCHNGNTHVNKLIEVSAGAYTSAGAPGDGYGTCSTASCHDNGTGTLVGTPAWGADVACVECHTTMTVNGPANGSHAIHMTTGATCTSCHASGTNPVADTEPSAGHRDGSIDTLAGLSYGNSTKGGAYSTCATASCHITNRNTAGLTPVWGGAAIIDCTECHTTPPTGDTHNTHLNAKTNNIYGQTIGCADCHDAATDVSTQTPPASGHKDGNIDAAGGYPAKLINDATYKTCNAAVCHQTGQAPSSFATTSNFNVDDADCTQCHTNAGLSASHAKHIAVNDCSTCHTGATKDTSYSLIAHGDGNVDVAVESSGYTANKAYSNSTQESCASISCHGDGLNTGGGDTPIWGTGAGCAACHESDMVTGSHAMHLADTVLTIGCGDCHTGATKDSSGGANHGNSLVNVAATYATPAAAIGSSTWTTCSAATCHDDGRAPNTSPAWGVTEITDCSECHATQPGTGSHTGHVGATALGSTITCGTCHSGALEGSTAPTANHRDGNTNATGYPVTTNGGAFQSCATINCHSDGVAATGITPIWGAGGNCATCHDSNMATGSHDEHLALDRIPGTPITCGDCHNGAIKDSNPGTAHIDGDIDVVAGYATVNAAYGVVSWTTCNAASCHDNGTGTLVTTPAWNTSTDDCTECHTTIPATGAHTKHLTQTTSTAFTINCTDCHAGAVWGASATTTGHRDGNVDVTGGYGYQADAPKGAPYTTCTTSYCHGDAMPKGTTSGINAPNWGTPNVAGCNFCHKVADTAVAIPSHSGVVATDCIDCHGAGKGDVNANGDGFTNAGLTHIDGTLNGGGDSCIDCHGNIGSALNGAHGAHNKTAYVGLLSASDYGNSATNDWYKVTYISGVPSFGCGFCHPSTVAGHTTKQVSLNSGDAGATGTVKALNDASASYAGGGGSCDATYCHSDGVNISAGTSPNWSGTFTGDKCANCHGNSPNTNAHELHVVGIHYEELYDNVNTGILTDAGAPGTDPDAAHGNSATSDAINCNVCHYSTVTVEYNSASSITAGTSCVTCHTSATGAAGTGGELMIIDTGSTKHINGVKDVIFTNMTLFKSKAQLRDDLADADDGSNILVNIWNRITGYKTAASTDQGKVADAGWTPGPKTCSTAVCHNGNIATWTDTGVDCMYCHTSLPK